MTRGTVHVDSFVLLPRLVPRIILTISFVELPGQRQGLNEDHEAHAHALPSITTGLPTHICVTNHHEVSIPPVHQPRFRNHRSYHFATLRLAGLL
jgi:hypothetical protein